jgi:hypothetical protein
MILIYLNLVHILDLFLNDHASFLHNMSHLFNNQSFRMDLKSTCNEMNDPNVQLMLLNLIETLIAGVYGNFYSLPITLICS